MSRAVERGKILELEELAAVLEAARSDGKTVVQCHGVFDLLHVGHIRHLREAKRWGDLLVVTVTPDRYVNKGPDRPTFPEMLRAEVLAALDDVDYVTINRWPTAFESISLLRPTVYAKGPDYADAAKDLTGGISKEAEAVRSAGGVIRFTDDLAFSSSSLINRFLSPYPPEVNDYLASFRWRHSFDDLLGYLESLRSLRVLVVGEAILDEYVYCDVIGKSTKEPILALRHNSIEQYAGGALAIANHVADFCAGVELISYLGALNPREEFVRRNLKPGVEAQFVYKRGSPTIVKRRFVEQYLVTKLMELYEIDDSPLDDEAEMGLQAILGPALERADLVIVADFGHGMISRHTVDLLVRGARFLAVNTQLNAANQIGRAHV